MAKLGDKDSRVSTRLDLMDQSAAAEFLSLSARTLEKWRLIGRGPRYRKLGRAVRYTVEDLEAFIEAGARSSTSDRGSAPKLTR